MLQQTYLTKKNLSFSNRIIPKQLNIQAASGSETQDEQVGKEEEQKSVFLWNIEDFHFFLDSKNGTKREDQSVSV